MNTAEHRDNTLLDIPKGMAAMHTSSLHGNIEEAIRFDAIGDALNRTRISYIIEFSRDKSTRTIFIDESEKNEGLETINRVLDGTEAVPDPQDDMRYIRGAYHRKVASLMANAA